MPRLRFLPPEEWGKLEGPLTRTQPDPKHTLILVAEEEGKIVGTWAATELITMEGLWVAEKYRGSALPVKIYNTMIEELKKLGVPGVLAVIENPSVISQAERLGFQYHLGHPMTLRID